MISLRWESWAAILAFAIALVYIWVPGPYPMGAFTFIAQPLFLLALVSYGIKVFHDLRSREVV
jgi:hypothetical protein